MRNNKILNIKEAIKVAKKIKKDGKRIVLVGGCFDILHVAHVKFLENAKKHGDFLFVLLESDQNVKKLKGINRPINNQKNRAIVLSSMTCIDYVVMLPNLRTNDQYDSIVIQIQPAIMATTSKDPNIIHKIRQAKLVNAKVVSVLQKISDQSTTRLAKLINQDLT